jgi:hypothetical protein
VRRRSPSPPPPAAPPTRSVPGRGDAAAGGDAAVAGAAPVRILDGSVLFSGRGGTSGARHGKGQEARLQVGGL